MKLLNIDRQEKERTKKMQIVAIKCLTVVCCVSKLLACNSSCFILEPAKRWPLSLKAVLQSSLRYITASLETSCPIDASISRTQSTPQTYWLMHWIVARGIVLLWTLTEWRLRASARVLKDTIVFEESINGVSIVEYINIWMCVWKNKVALLSSMPLL